MDVSNPLPVSSDRLQQAYATLMERAPSALFRKARQLYLNKYCLDGREPLVGEALPLHRIRRERGRLLHVQEVSSTPHLRIP